MRYYQEVKILPSQEVSEAFIWEKLYRQLHIGLVSLKDEDDNVPLGVSFPGYQLSPRGLGHQLRIFAEEEQMLKALKLDTRLERLKDYVQTKRISPVPDVVQGYAVYRRVHQTKSVAQKARRYAKRHFMSFDDAEKLFPQKSLEEKYPYLQLESLTNKKRFSLFISKEHKERPANGKFNVYGLSSETTVPEF